MRYEDNPRMMLFIYSPNRLEAKLLWIQSVKAVRILSLNKGHWSEQTKKTTRETKTQSVRKLGRNVETI